MKLLLLAAFLSVPIWGQNEQDVATGKALFRSNCAFCHGLTATGGRGPSLISPRLIQNTTDANVKAIIKNGIPGTTMPAFESLQADDLDHLVHYIRNLAGSDIKPVVIIGDAAHGQQLYSSNGCANCHRIGSTGSIYGPELSRVGAARSIEYLKQSITDPSADIQPEYEGVTAVTRDGKRIRGVRINEDTFSVQLRKPDQTFALFDKAELKEVVHETKSLMPAYQTLPAKDLNDLVAYMETLRGGVAASTDAQRAKGIH